MTTELERLIARRDAIVARQAEHELTKWRPRDYQQEVWDALHEYKRVVAVWHRRAGKDTTFLHFTVEAAMERPGIYWHMLPTSVQARKVIWDGRTKEGKPFLDAWKDCKITKRREDEMKLEFENGSIWQCVGSDKFDSLVGSNPVGVVLSEYAVAYPRAWDYIRPILAENGGWAAFPYTPRGRNHGFRLYDMAKDDPDWYASLLTAEDTGAITKEAIDAERRQGMSEEMIEQEFYCSFDAPLHGSFYGTQMTEVINSGRFTSVPHDPSLATYTFWDLGHSDSTTIWFAQFAGQEIHLIDYHETHGEPLSYYASILQEKQQERRLVYGGHQWPHDGGHKTLASGGRPLNELMADLNVEVQVAAREANIMPGIDRVRAILHRCWFDAERCARGVEALKSYRREEDEKKGTRHGSEIVRFFKPNPLHDWSSHGADSFRGLALGLDSLPSVVSMEPINYPDGHVSRMVV